MSKRLFIQCISILISSFSYGQVKDYSELKYVYSDLVEVFKSKNDSVLKEFCYRLAVDQHTADYMHNNHLCYRGVPCELDGQNLDLTFLGDKFYPNLLSIRNQLKQAGLLDNLVHLNSTLYRYDVVVIIQKKVAGLNKPVSQQDFSMSASKYEKLLAHLDSSGQTMNDFLLKGENGDVYVIHGTEEPIIMKSGNVTIEYSIGEMVLVNNKWSLFTKPNTSYTLSKE